MEDFIRYPLRLRHADYYSKIKDITMTCKNIKIYPLIYGKRFFYEGDLFKDFFKRVFDIDDINIPIDSSYLVGISLKGESVLAFRKLREEFEIHSFLAEEIYKYLVELDNYEGNKLKNLLTLKDRLHILDYYKKSNDMLFKEFFKSDNQWILSEAEISNYESIEKYHIEHSDEIEKAIDERYNKAKQKLFEIIDIQKRKFVINDWGYKGIHGRVTKINNEGIEGWILDIKNLQPLTYQIYIEGILAIEKQAEGDPEGVLNFFSIDKFVPCGISFKWEELLSNQSIINFLLNLPADKVLDILVVEKSTQKGIYGDYPKIPTIELLNALNLKVEAQGNVDNVLETKDVSYKKKILEENEKFNKRIDQAINIHDLPEISHYYSQKYKKPNLEKFNILNIWDFFAKPIRKLANQDINRKITIASLGSRTCEVEIEIINFLLKGDVSNTEIHCYDLNEKMLEIGRNYTEKQGISKYFKFILTDINSIKFNQTYDVFIANHSLHHFLELEHIFENIRKSMHQESYFIVNDMIGRNGHMRWPEHLSLINDLWNYLPYDYRYNTLLKRYEEKLENWDCSKEGFEGIRAQDILPLLTIHFNFEFFYAFGGIIDVFVGRKFGHHFNLQDSWDLNFIDYVANLNNKLLLKKYIKPTQLLAYLTIKQPTEQIYVNNLSPFECIRNPNDEPKEYTLNELLNEKIIETLPPTVDLNKKSKFFLNKDYSNNEI